MKNKLPKCEVVGTDDVSWILVEGHVDIKTFNKAIKKRVSTDPAKLSDVAYEYWRKNKDGSYRGCQPSVKGAKKYTVWGQY